MNQGNGISRAKTIYHLGTNRTDWQISIRSNRSNRNYLAMNESTKLAVAEVSFLRGEKLNVCSFVL